MRRLALLLACFLAATCSLAHGADADARLEITGNIFQLGNETADIRVIPQDANQLTSSFPAQGNVAQFEVFSDSTEPVGLPKKGVKTHNPANCFAPGFSGAASHQRDFDMFLDFNRTLRVTALSIAMGSTLAACGGGGATGDEPTATVSSVGATTATTATTAGTASTGTTAGTASADATGTAEQATGAYNSATSSTVSAASAPSDNITVASVTPDVTTTQAAAVAVSAASTNAANGSATGGAPTSTAPAPAPAPAKTVRSGVGVNVGTMDTYSSEFPTIDFMKRAGPWFTGSASTFSTQEESKLDLDANGWPKTLPAANDTTVKYRYVTSVLSSGSVPDGQYVVKYDGAGTITYSGVVAKIAAQSTAGRDIVQVTNSTSGGFFLTIKATTPGNYLRNIRVYPPGGACANDYTTFAADASACTGTKGAFVLFENFPASKPWYPPFFHDLKGFRTLRFMDWQRTNSTTLSAWAQRPLATDRVWTNPGGVPLESMIQLSNDLGADPWMNLSPYVTDDYVHQFAKLMHEKMASNLTLNLEYGNEPWNYAFAATKWMQSQATTLWAAEVAKGADVYVLQTNWYARRLAQVCTIAKGEFGADASRVRCIANSQAAGSWMTKQTLACTYAAAALGKPCGKFFDVVAIAPYFAQYIGNPKMRSVVTNWYGEADGGLNSMFQEITGKDATGATVTVPMAVLNSGAPTGALNLVKSMMTATKAVLDAYGLPMWAYEGGQSLVVYGGDSDPKILPLMLATNRDARMGAAYTQHIADWKAAGGQTFAFYNHTFVPSKYGIWGLKENLKDDANPKWQAVLKARDGTACWWSGC